MLTSTFSLAAISMEQQYVRCILSSIERSLEGIDWGRAPGKARESIEATCRSSVALAAFFRSRKIEAHVIPALRPFTAVLDSTLSELDMLSTEADEVLQGIVGQVARYEECAFDTATLVGQMKRYCQCLDDRVTIEETRLLPTARALLSPDAWFSIGVACLMASLQKQERRPAKPSSRLVVASHE